MAKRTTDKDTPSAPRRRAKTTAPGPAEISIAVPVSEAADFSTPGLARSAPPSTSEIAQRAYELYAEQGYMHGHDLDHWLAAEHELGSGSSR